MAFQKNDRVTKITGDYGFDGIVDSVFEKQDGKTRLVVEDERGALHVYSEQNLRLIGNNADHQYLRVLKNLVEKGVYREGRNGGTYGLFGEQLRFDLSEGFPLLTTKKVHFKSILVELLWFIRGDTNIKFLHDHGVTIWDEWRQPHSMTRRTVKVSPKTAVTNAAYSGSFSVAGVNAEEGSPERILTDTWVRMMKRCYDIASDKYPFYGAKGVTVHPEWHSVENFMRDAVRLPHWENKVADPAHFDLDKDYFGAGQYGPGTSVWLAEEENALYRENVKPVKVTQSDGTSKVFISASVAARHFDIPTSTLNRFLNTTPTALKGNNRRFVGWSFEYVNEPGVLYRLELIEKGDLGPIYSAQWRDFNGIDQLKSVIEGLKNDPHGRRHIVSAWNPTEVDSMALPPCHTLFQFHVANGKLNCQLYQRSADWFLGVPFNIASYALLTHLVAREVGLEPGEFVHTFGDLHLYANHVEQAKEQLTRQPVELPWLKIAADDHIFSEELRPKKSIFELEPADIVLEDYNPAAAIKAPVSK